jgi:RNA polymerase sigma-70 factor (ECF subfamily)
MYAVENPGPEDAAPLVNVNIAALADFDELYRCHHGKLVGLAYVLTNNRPVAEDIVADAFAAAWRSWGRIGTYEDPAGWLRRVVINRSASRRRRLSVEARAMVRLRHRATQVVEMSATDIQLWDAVRSLPTRQAQMIALRYVADLSEASAAEHLGIGLETARTHLKRARHRLSVLLGENGDQT